MILKKGAANTINNNGNMMDVRMHLRSLADLVRREEWVCLTATSGADGNAGIWVYMRGRFTW